MAPPEFNLTHTFQFDIFQNLIFLHIFDPASQPLRVPNVYSKGNQRMIIIHLNLVYNGLPDHPLTHERHLFQIQHDLRPRLRLLHRLELADLTVLVSAVYLISVDPILLLL